MARRRNFRLPWYRRFYRRHKALTHVSLTAFGIIAVQFYFSNRIDKDEYERIIGGLIFLGVQEFIRRKA